MFALVKMLKTRVGSDRGASALEYIGAVIVAALVVSAVVAGVEAVDLKTTVSDKLKGITGQGPNKETGTGEGNGNGGGEDE